MVNDETYLAGRAAIWLVAAFLWPDSPTGQSETADTLSRESGYVRRHKMFELGYIVATAGVAALGVDFTPFLARHIRGDWGELDEFDRRQNNLAVQEGYRLLSAYTVDEAGTRIWIITEADRSVTTILSPEEY
ncbi:MAG: hypothetical protein AB1791_00285 [Chloroflexota bacterium]